jgi:hypothetical protein
MGRAAIRARVSTVDRDRGPAPGRASSESMPSDVAFLPELMAATPTRERDFEGRFQ